MKKNTIKKLMAAAVLALSGGGAMAQNGLENVIVERYYVSDANDAANSVGALPVGSVTYRIFVDMRNGYNFQALYGVPGHALNFHTTTCFFNNEDRGAITPAIATAYLNDNSVALDSWVSVGSCGNGHIGVLKSEDDGVSNLVATGNPMLQNNDASAGIPLTSQDGMILGTVNSPTLVGFTSELDIIDATSCMGNDITTSDASIASLGGTVGPDTTNKVLVGQFTTDGEFCFFLNIQIGTPGGGTQSYVSSSPVGSEITIPSLIFCSTVGINTPAANATPSVSVYPNPTSDIIKLDITTSSKINNDNYKIMDVLGNVVLQSSISGYQSTIDVSTLSTGMYFIEVNLDGVKTVKKIVKK